MGGIRRIIQVDGHEFWTLFDTGARNTYIVPAVAQLLAVSKAPAPLRTAIGGQVKTTDTAAVLQAKIEGRPISTHALVIDEIGRDEDGRQIEILFGALAMQQGGGSGLFPTRKSSTSRDIPRSSWNSERLQATHPGASRPGAVPRCCALGRC